MKVPLQVIHQQVFKGQGVLNAYSSLILFQTPPVFETMVER